jgi:uncharacterized protein (TIGR00255 family)
MISSMTGHGRLQWIFREREVVFEVKSVNNRYKEIKWRVPQEFMPLTYELKSDIDKTFARGTFDFSFQNLNHKGSSSIHIDWKKAKNFIQDFERELSLEKGQCQLNPCDFLRPDFSLEQSDFSDEEKEQIKKHFRLLLEDLKSYRLKEGNALKAILLQHFHNIKLGLEDVKELRLTMKENYHQKLSDMLKKATEATDLSEDQQWRVFQECAFLLEKYDVDEEINRLSSHLDSVDQLLNGKEKKEQSMGRKLEFFVQECHREINTLGSKSQILEMTKKVVDMKCELEKIREQILNIE